MSNIIEEIARQFKIPLDEAKRRMDIFLSELPKYEMSDELKRKQREAMDALKKSKKKSKMRR